MRVYMACLWLIVCICHCTTLGQTSNEREGKKPAEEEIKQWPLPQQAAYRAATYMAELPNFLVTEIVSRSTRVAHQKDWQAQDKLEIDLAYGGKKGETYTLKKMNDRPTSQSFEKVFGATSSGEFGGFLAGLVDPHSQAQFKPVTNEVFRGRKTVLFEFRILKANSNYLLTEKESRRQVKTGLAGTVWVDTETARMLRLEMSVEDVQPGFPLTMAEHAVEYDWVTIAGKKYWMPISAEFIVGSDTTKFYARNVTEFKNYRVFETEVKIVEEKSSPK